MNRRKIIKWTLFALSILLFEKANSQYVTIPDPVFASFISSKYPAIISGNQLDTVQAKTITGIFDARLKNINDVSGIQYFTNITKLYLNQNNLTFLPAIKSLTKLTEFWVDTNSLSTVPDFRTMTNLQDFRCTYNNITSLPSMNGLSNLTRFFCNHNKLTSLPTMVGLSSLDHFICSDNLISSLPDMSTHLVLRRFLCANNLFTEVDLTMIPNLKEFHFRYNKLVKFPVITGMTQLTEIQVQHNYIDSLPDLSAFTNLNIFDISYNNLTFEDLLPLIPHPDFGVFVLPYQGKVGKSASQVLKVGNTFTINLNIDNSVTSNQFYWYKNGAQVALTSVNTFSIPSLSLSDNGTYSCKIKNTTLPLDTITLMVNPLDLSVIKCIDVSKVKPTTIADKCEHPVQITINESQIYGAVAPYTYSVRNTIANTTNNFSTPAFNLSVDGIYDLIIKDVSGCQDTLYNGIVISRTNCDPIFFPDLTDAQSTYFIEPRGTARIYSTSGAKIREMPSPGYWDGRNSSGEMMDTGLYVIIINEQIKIQVSLRRTN